MLPGEGRAGNQKLLCRGRRKVKSRRMRQMRAGSDEALAACARLRCLLIKSGMIVFDALTSLSPLLPVHGHIAPQIGLASFLPTRLYLI